MIELRLVKQHAIDDELRASEEEHIAHMMVLDAMVDSNNSRFVPPSRSSELVEESSPVAHSSTVSPCTY